MNSKLMKYFKFKSLLTKKILTLSLLIIFGCDNGSAQRQSPSKSSAVSKPVLKNKKKENTIIAPDFTLADLEGNLVSMNQFQGKVVLGKYANVTPTKLVVQGQEINIASAIDSTGAATLDFNVGNIGEKIINGQFTFLEDGKPLEIPILGNYVVVPRPKEASVAADKMNVLYRGLENPMTISFAGVSDNNVVVSAPGLRKAGAQGKYIINPPSGINNLIVTVLSLIHI